jgi:hypothetical protein
LANQVTEKTPAQKLLIRPDQQVRLINPPPDLDQVLGSLPKSTSRLDDSAEAKTLVPADVVVLFANGRTDLETLLPGVRAAISPGGKIWVAYHKGTSRVKTDINRDSINAYAQSIGLQGVAMISINDDWSALRLKII